MVEILRITYYLYEFKRTKQGEVPIYCKLTTDGINRQQFSTRLYIRPEIWDKDAQCVRGTSEDAVLINRRLQDITVELKSIERKLYEADGNVSLDEIYSLYKNKTANEHTLCGIFRERIKRMESLVGKEYSPSTIIGQTKCALFTNEMCKKKIFFHAKLKAFNQCLNSV